MANYSGIEASKLYNALTTLRDGTDYNNIIGSLNEITTTFNNENIWRAPSKNVLLGYINKLREYHKELVDNILVCIEIARTLRDEWNPKYNEIKAKEKELQNLQSEVSKYQNLMNNNSSNYKKDADGKVLKDRWGNKIRVDSYYKYEDKYNSSKSNYDTCNNDLTTLKQQLSNIETNINSLLNQLK